MGFWVGGRGLLWLEPASLCVGVVGRKGLADGCAACPACCAGDRQYFLSLRYGHILDRQRLLELLEGRLAEEGPLQEQQQEGGAGGQENSAGEQGGADKQA